MKNGVKRSIGYIMSWSVVERKLSLEVVNPNLLTHLNYAFANLENDGTVINGNLEVDTILEFPQAFGGKVKNPGLMGQIQYMKEQYPHLKVMISIGGWTWSKNFSDVAASEKKRMRFAETAVEFVVKYGFDGIDIDWEYPVKGGDNIKHRPEDKENYTKLLKVAREKLTEQGKKDGKEYLLSIAAKGNADFMECVEPEEMMKYLDFMNLMTYDFMGSWDTKTGHNAGLYPTNPEDRSSISETVEAFISAGIHPEKMNLGLPFYGRGWIDVESAENNGLGQKASAAKEVGYRYGTREPASFDYFDLKENYIGKNGYVRYFDPIAKVPFLFDGKDFISYDDEESVLSKLKYAEEKELGGAMFWEFFGDKEKDLQQVIYNYYNR